jgi:hypothetical protein
MTPRSLLPILLCLLAGPALAQTQAETVPAPDATQAGVVRLSPQEREAAIEQGAARAARDAEHAVPSDRKIHGELGVEIGTGGTRAAYGSAIVPLGDTGVAAFAFETDRSNYRFRRR